MGIALAITLAVYATVAITVLAVLGPDQLATAAAPLAEAVRAAGAGGFEPVVRAGATAAALGSLLSLMLGVSRTSLAMARDGHLPAGLAAVHPHHGVPHRAEVVVGVVVAILAAVADVRGAIGFSSFAVLIYYGIANAAAVTLGRRTVPIAGLAGCLLLAVFLPIGSVLAGTTVIVLGAAIYSVRRAR